MNQSDDRRCWGRVSRGTGDRRTLWNRVVHQRELGSATAEVAVLLPSIALLLAVLLWVGMIGATQVSVQQAAREVAREIARGQEQESAVQTAQRVAGSDASVRTSGAGQLAHVQVSKNVSIGGIGWLTIQLSGEATVLSEQP